MKSQKKFNLDLDFGTSMFSKKALKVKTLPLLIYLFTLKLLMGRMLIIWFFTYTDADKRLDAVKMYEKFFKPNYAFIN